MCVTDILLRCIYIYIDIQYIHTHIYIYTYTYIHQLCSLYTLIIPVITWIRWASLNSHPDSAETLPPAQCPLDRLNQIRFHDVPCPILVATVAGSELSSARCRSLCSDNSQRAGPKDCRSAKPWWRYVALFSSTTRSKNDAGIPVTPRTALMITHNYRNIS